MNIPTTVTFHGVETSEALRADVLEHVQRLERFTDDILSCRVVIDSAERKHHQGNRFNVRVRLVMRGREMEAGGRAPTPDARHEDPYVAVADTFNALRRRVEDYARRRRGDVKARPQRTPET